LLKRFEPLEMAAHRMQVEKQRQAMPGSIREIEGAVELA
jgi:hypothetical protein